MRVLIVEDEWLVAAALRKQVESHGYEVIGTVGNGAQALGVCRAQQPDLVLMDVQMPLMDGIAATRALMIARPTCVVIVTGKAKQEADAAEAGAMECVMKPLLGCQVPKVIEVARRRFARFQEVLGEEKSLEGALAAWQTVQGETKALSARDGISEEAAFAALQQRAWEDGLTLAEAAAGLNGNGRH